MAANLLSGLVQGYAQAQQRQHENFLNDALKKAQVKLYKQQLDKADQTNAALDQIESMMGGQPAAAPAGQESIGPSEAPKSLSSILADPKGQLAAMRSGLFSGKEIIDANRKDNFGEILKSLQGDNGAPGNLSIQDIVIGPDGTPSLKLGRNDIKHWEPSPDNMFSIGYDSQGKEITRVPIGVNPSVQTIDTPDGPKIVTVDPRTGRQVAEIGSPSNQIGADQSGRVASVAHGLELLPEITDIIFPNGIDGKADRLVLANASIGTPGTKGRMLKQQMNDAIDAVIRARTGAAAPETEMKRLLDQFMPSALDNDNTARDKLKRLEQFLTGTIEATTLPQSLRKYLKSGSKGNTINFEDLPE